MTTKPPKAAPKDKAEKKAKSKKKTRKPVGDGTCFNTCLEIYIKLKHPGISDTKIYKTERELLQG